MVKLKFWSIYSHIETSVIKIMRDIHANTLFVVECFKKAPSQAKWWDLSDLHIQNLGEIDKIWVYVKIWMIQYNLSDSAHFVSEYIWIFLESSRPPAFSLCSSGHSGAKPRRKKNQVSDPEHGETSQLLVSPSPGAGGVCCRDDRDMETLWACDNVTWCECCDHWPVERDTGGHTTHCPVTSAPMGWPVPGPHNGRGFTLTPVICPLPPVTANIRRNKTL